MRRRTPHYPYREPVYTCVEPDTYRYYVAPEAIPEVWRVLGEKYGRVVENKGFRTRQIVCDVFLIRASVNGNPITLIRRHRCSPRDVSRFHDIVGFRESRFASGKRKS